MRIVIPLFDGVTALDAVGPFEVLKYLPGAEVVFVADRPGPVREMSGRLALHADAAWPDIERCDVLLVPGGPGVERLLTDAPFLAWVARMHATATWTTSVCSGSVVLAAAGLLTGRRATTHWGRAATGLARYGATYTAERVVVHGSVVTAAGVSAGIDMALTLTALITDRTTAEAVQLALEYDPQPPFDAGSPAKASAAARERLATLVAA